ncbi:hypothetical protein OSTOST_06552 [Ostertagia ostertagi]
MGEDAQLEEPDEGYGLSPAHDESLKLDEEADRWICSIDGSCINKGRRPYEQYELQPCSEITLDEQQALRPAVSRETTAMSPAMILDDSQPVFRNISRRQQSSVYEMKAPSSIFLPQPLDTSTKKDRSPIKRSKAHHKSSLGARREISPIARVSSFDCLQKSVCSSAQIYDPLRRASSQISMSLENGFSAELKSQGDKLMNGLKAILKERIVQEKLSRPPSYPSAQPTLVTALSSRAGSVSTVSTGRDPLTKEVRLLREALDGFDLIGRAQGGTSPLPKGDETIPDSFTMPDEVVSLERPASGSRGTSAVEQARLSSRGSIQLISDNGIRDTEHSSTGLRRLGRGAFDRHSEKHLREQGVNTHKVPVRHVVITHRVKHELDHGSRRSRFHIGSLHSDERPRFQPFKLRSAPDDSYQLLDIDSVPHLGRRGSAAFEGAAARATIHGQENEETGHHAPKQRKSGGGKRGRPVVIGRSLYSRGRVHFRPHVHYHPLPRSKSSDEVSPPAEEGAVDCGRHDAAIMTEKPETRPRTDDKAADEAAQNQSDDEDSEDEDLPTVRRKSPASKKQPFVGSGLKASNTFSIAGNQQQVMKVTSTRFQEWLPLVRSIIYDSRCKDYAHALQRDLTRQKRSHSEQMRLLHVDLDECKTEAGRREIRADIARLKQQWTGKHDRVLSCLNEHISKGGVWSKVQQLRTIYSALVS